MAVGDQCGDGTGTRGHPNSGSSLVKSAADVRALHATWCEGRAVLGVLCWACCEGRAVLGVLCGAHGEET